MKDSKSYSTATGELLNLKECLVEVNEIMREEIHLPGSTIVKLVCLVTASGEIEAIRAWLA